MARVLAVEKSGLLYLRVQTGTDTVSENKNTGFPPPLKLAVGRFGVAPFYHEAVVQMAAARLSPTMSQNNIAKVLKGIRGDLNRNIQVCSSTSLRSPLPTTFVRQQIAKELRPFVDQAWNQTTTFWNQRNKVYVLVGTVVQVVGT